MTLCTVYFIGLKDYQSSIKSKNHFIVTVAKNIHKSSEYQRLEMSHIRFFDTRPLNQFCFTIKVNSEDRVHVAATEGASRWFVDPLPALI